MFHRHVELYLHFVWSTWDRVPWIDPPIQARLHALIASVARQQACPLVVVGGVSDHVHVLVRAPPTVCPADLASKLKGASSYFAHHELDVDRSCRWSQGYALFSVDPEGVDDLAVYILNQANHHAQHTADPRREEPA